MMEKLNKASLKFVKCRVRAIKNGAVYNPTGDVVTMTFTLSNDVTSAVWHAADWETLTGNDGLPEYWARCLVGPGGTATLTPEIYVVSVKIVDNPEIPVENSGLLKVY